MKIVRISGICFCGILQFLSFPIFAATPVWTITPLTPTSFSVTTDSNVTAQYQVTNQSTLTHVLVMQPVAGITQVTSNGYCANPFSLSYQQSCILNLQIQGKGLQGNVSDAPIVCETGDKLMCYQPPGANRLSISLFNKINLTTGSSPLSLTVGGGSGAITITNPSDVVTVTNLQADLTGTALAGNVTQNATNCASLPPGQTCTLTFSPILNAVTLTSFPIVGANANPAAGQIQITAASNPTITVSGSPLTLQATTGTPVTGSVTITNQSSTLTANNISADISGALATGGVVENSSNCSIVLPHQSCNLVFTPGTQAVSNTNVSIQGTNTSVTTANISVNAAPQASLTITAGSPLEFSTSGNSGAITIQNNSLTENALNISSNFTGTALNGLVTQTASTCSSVAPGATCILTFTPGSTVVAQTNFPIQGSNTNSVNGAALIAVPIHIIFVTQTATKGGFGGTAGGNTICNADANKPTSGFATLYTYKAIIYNNNATVSGVSYYRPDGVTLIATANGSDLVGNASINNAVSTVSANMWTGQSGDNCINWTNSTSSYYGQYGSANSATNTWWLAGLSVYLCNSSLHLYCASQ